MKRKWIIWGMFTLAFGVTTGVSAQKVIDPSLTNGCLAIDVTELAPLGCVLTNAEAATRRSSINAQTPSNNAFLGVGINYSGPNGIWNAKVSPLFQVMNYDLGTTFTWADAYTACRYNKQISGGIGEVNQWRLPTQRELMLIWVLHPQLLNKGSFTAFKGLYWSGTENESQIDAFHVDFSRGSMEGGSLKFKSDPINVRCVRDI